MTKARAASERVETIDGYLSWKAWLERERVRLSASDHWHGLRVRRLDDGSWHLVGCYTGSLAPPEKAYLTRSPTLWPAGSIEGAAS